MKKNRTPEEKERYNAYMANYMTERYHRRRAEAVKRLGGVCIDCGSADRLELDHADRGAKAFDIAKILSTGSETKVQAELEKCVLRCKPCHRTKTTLERGQTPASGTHGTHAALRYCKPRCAVCKRFSREYQAAWRRRKAEAPPQEGVAHDDKQTARSETPGVVTGVAIGSAF